MVKIDKEKYKSEPMYGVVPPVQAKYGVVPPVQAKYGVVPPIDIQPAYGVPPISIQPAYGVVYPVDVNVSYNDLEDCIARLKKTINTLKSSWTNGSKKQIARIKESWVGADCEAYTQKLEGMDQKVNKSIEALELLCSTYEKARDLVLESQKKSTDAVNNM